MEEYATQVFREFGIGDKNKNNGLLLLLALEERKFRVEVGYGLEGVLPDAKTGRIQDEYIIPYLKNDNWNEGIKNGFSAFLNIIANEYNVDIEQEQAIKIENNTSSENINFSVLYVSVMFGYVISAINKHRTKKFKTTILIIIYALVLGIITYIITNSVSLIVINIIMGLIGNAGGYILSSNRMDILSEAEEVSMADQEDFLEVLVVAFLVEEVHQEVEEAQEDFKEVLKKKIIE